MPDRKTVTAAIFKKSRKSQQNDRNQSEERDTVSAEIL